MANAAKVSCKEQQETGCWYSGWGWRAGAVVKEEKEGEERRPSHLRKPAVERGRELRDPFWSLSLWLNPREEKHPGQKLCSWRRGPRAEAWATLTVHRQAEEEGCREKLRRNHGKVGGD